MENSNYDKYIRSILGHQTPNSYNSSNYYENDMYGELIDNRYPNYYEQFTNNNMYYNNVQNSNMNMQNQFKQNYPNQDILLKRDIESQIEPYYPDIYKTIYPMIVKRCNETREEITEEKIEEIVDDIYNQILDSKDIIDTKISESNSSLTTIGKTPNRNIEKVSSNKKELNEQEKRQTNRWLRDLIKILLLRELINRPGLLPPRPPRPGYPNNGTRPPMFRNPGDGTYSHII